MYPMELPLEAHCYGFASIFGVATTTTIGGNSLNTNGTILWNYWQKIEISRKESNKIPLLGLFMHPLILSFSIAYRKFKFNSKSNGAIEMCFLLFKYSKCKIEKGCDKLPFYKQYIFSSETFERQSSTNLDILDWPRKKMAWNRKMFNKKKAWPNP